MQFKTPYNQKKENKIEKEFKNLRKELLDLSLRNPLLNFKERNKTLSITNQSSTNVYKTLILENKKMHFIPAKEENKDKSKAHAFINHTKELFSNEKDKNLQADLSPSALQKRLFYIDQQAKTMVQEQGYNILYIAIGFIEWVDKKKKNQKNLAPLILIPVEMHRKKAGNSFSLSWTGEDLQNNISLQAKLREDGIELPKFEQTSYIEGVNQYFESVKQTIAPVNNWNVVDKVALGFFSFTKFVMYNDLNPESWKENVDLTKKELIEAIFNPSKNIYDDTFEEEEVDEKLHYKTMYQVLDADSSQIAVIENVKAGHNLVVEGPPGTGKSQTIVNLIAELIAEGKTVLFVSEKMAALEVVKSRLDSVGLGKFVLELHSHKTRRKKLLKNLQRATNVRATRDLKLDQTLRKLENLRNQLDEYAEIIHKPIANVKLSPFELYGMKESAEDYFSKENKMLPLVRFDNPEDISEKDLDDIILSLENLAELYSTISKNNPWSYCNPKSLLPADLREIELLISDSLDSLNDFRYEMNVVNEVYGIKIPDTLKEYQDSIMALNLLDNDNIKLVDSSILLNEEWYSQPEKALELIKLLENYQKASGLFDKFTDYILIADLDTLIHDIQKDLNKKFRIFGGNSHKDELNRLYNGNVPNDKQVLNELIQVRQNIKIRQNLKDAENLGERYFGNLWSKNSNINELKELNSWMIKFTYLLSNNIFSENTIKLLSNDLFQINIDSGIDEYIDKGNKFYNNLTKLESKLNPRSKLIFKKESDEVPFDKWEKQLNKWKGQLSSLHLWSQYSNTKRACIETKASIFIKTIEKRNIKKDEVKSLVLGNFADGLLNGVFNESETLSTFIGELHENRIREFQDLDRKIINLNRKRIFNKLNSQIPEIFGGADNEEAKILAGEFTRKSGHLPVRTLLERAGGIIKQIKPIFMMSPLSIAQYLDPTNPKLQFDVVIFDEASQVKPEDALGAFMRGNTAVVMGDTQQLPPTSFFDQMTDSESGEEVATALDMESILHLCKLSFPVKMLKWHYRSRHESLINISNREFYDNELLVYPSPSHNDPELGLKFHYNPDTAYDRGNSSANYKEAKDVVKEIFKHFAKYGDKKSLGVGTFSVAQKNAILEELEIERKAHPEYEPLFSDKKNERFFVKNLETIQGDERDVILISVGYGFDTEGKMSLNFGPLNQDGGERRLNVLITRAREKCVVFTNFKSHDIHLTANPPFGVKSLKNFLEYAENLQLNQRIDIDDDEETPFEDAIHNFLIDNGYDVDKRIGCAGFRVDLAIIDDENPGKYLLGIECDGKGYASSKVARDRDRLREQVLTGLGWNIYHLWSTDWYRNRDLAKSRLLDYIETTKIETKVNDIKSKIHAIETMQITPVTSIIIEKPNDNNENNSDNIIDENNTNINEDNLNNEFDSENNSNINEDNLNNESDNKDKDADNNITNITNEIHESNNNDINDIDTDGINNKINTNEINIHENSKNNIIDSNDKTTYIGNQNTDEESFINTDIKVNKTNSNENYGVFDIENNKENLISKFLENFPEDKETNETENTIINESNKDNEIINSNMENKGDNKESTDYNLNKNSEKNKDINDKLTNVDEGFIFDNKKSENDVSNEISYKNNSKNQTSTNKLIKDVIKENINNKLTEIKTKNNIKDKTKTNEDKSNINVNIDENNTNNDRNSLINEKLNENNIRINNKPKFKKSVDFNEITEDLENDIETVTKENNINIKRNEEIEENIEDEQSTVPINENIIAEIDNNIVNNKNLIDKSSKNLENDKIKDIHSKDSEFMNLFNKNSKKRFKNNIEYDSNSSLNNNLIDKETYKVSNISDKLTAEESDYAEEFVEDNSNDYTKPIIPINAELRDEQTNQENNEYDEEDFIVPIENEEYQKQNNEDINDKNNIRNNLNDNSIQENNMVNNTDKDNDYYYSAIGMENTLKKNAINYKRKDSHKKGLAGSISNLKNEIKYIDATLKQIENPTEREKIYVIDRSSDEFGDFESYNEFTNETIIPNNKDYSNYNTDEIKESKSNSNYKELVNNSSPEYSIEDYVDGEFNSNETINEHITNNNINQKNKTSENIHLNESSIASGLNYQPSMKEYPAENEYLNNNHSNNTLTDSININNNSNEKSDISNDLNNDLNNNLNNNLNTANKSNSKIDFNKTTELEMDEEEFESIINDIDQDYKEIEKERIEKSNVLNEVDNTRLTPNGEIEDYIIEYKKIEDIPIKNANEIYEDDEKLDNTVKQIIIIEGPIHEDTLIRRIRESCNLSRAGSKFKNTIKKSIKRIEDKGLILNEEGFLFKNYDQIAIRKRDKPNIDFISDLEIEKSIDLILSFKKSVKVKELSKKVSRTFGFKSTSKKTSNKINSVVDMMIGQGKLINNNGKIEFK